MLPFEKLEEEIDKEYEILDLEETDGRAEDNGKTSKEEWNQKNHKNKFHYTTSEPESLSQIEFEK